MTTSFNLLAIFAITGTLTAFPMEPVTADSLDARAASQAGAQILIIGIVQKRSTLVQVAWTVAVDTTSQRVVFRKFFTFRGDNDEAWQRAERFVSEEVRDRLLESRSQQ